MKILIATGIYPPQLGGPATYAKNIRDAFLSLKHEVFIKRFTIENKLPTVIRHIWFFFKSFVSILKSDFSFYQSFVQALFRDQECYGNWNESHSSMSLWSITK